MTDETILELRDVTKTFGGLVAIDNVSATVASEETVGIIGPNGAGKTTLFNLITGLLRPDSGTIEFQGTAIQDESPEQRVRRGIGRSFQITNIFADFSVFENVHMAVQSHHGHNRNVTANFRTVGDTHERTLEVLEQVDLADKQDVTASTLSYGDKRVLELGITLGLDPDLLMLDEPTAGMSEQETDRIISLVKDLGDDRSILFIEHNMEAVTDISDRIFVLDQGKRLAFDDTETIRDDPEVREIYVGSEEVA